MVMTDPVWVLFGAALCVLASARLTRLFVHDGFPPAVWLRRQWIARFGSDGWGLLATCHYCLSMWATGVVVAAGAVSGWAEWWWFVTAVLGLSYVAAMVVSRDGEE